MSSIIGRCSNQPVGRLRFLPLGVFWGLVAGSLTTFRYISSPIGLLGFDGDAGLNWWKVEQIVVPILGAVAGSLLIAILLGNALLYRNSSSIRWLVDWVITGAASCAGGAAVFRLIFELRRLAKILELFLPTFSYDSPDFLYAVGVIGVLWGGMFVLMSAVLMGIVSAMLALLLAPLALLGRRLILRRTRVAETVGDGTQAQP